MSDRRKQKLKHCSTCNRHTAHELVGRYFVQSAGMLPGVKWEDPIRRTVYRCLGCRTEGDPPGISCAKCRGTSFRVKFTRQKGPGVTIRVKVCKTEGCETEVRTIERIARGK